jgi:tRNA-specific 2-thiouridylase
MSRVVLAMSGGVDSSVAAHLLREQGHEVIGVFMRHGEASAVACSAENGSMAADGRIGNPSYVAETVGQTSRPSFAPLPVISGRLDHKQGCCSAADAEDARRVADRLGIPFYALDFQQEFGRIIDYFVEEYTAARTPNPCVMCNNWLKFGKLFDFADSVGAEYVATGHYARVQEVRDAECGVRSDDWPGFALLRGIDVAKDQSYVLFGIERRFLSRMLLPVGGHTKPKIRAIATELELRVADKRDSQEICFVTSGHHAEFVRRRRGDEDMSGEIVTTDGAVVGRHRGIEGFTIGQRKGLGVAFGEPRYVVRIEADTRRVVVGTHGELARATFKADRANWLIDPPAEPFRCHVQVRYNSAATAATVTPLGLDQFAVSLDEPRHGVAPGQAAVCYAGNRVLGGGWIL